MSTLSTPVGHCGVLCSRSGRRSNSVDCAVAPEADQLGFGCGNDHQLIAIFLCKLPEIDHFQFDMLIMHVKQYGVGFELASFQTKMQYISKYSVGVLYTTVLPQIYLFKKKI
ncbi:hypothetical protein T07_9303 [Trichinella nelsoni]|uniref:Uncharacterized protein n=1 Tax=Trichinella nelsoni TaxID=6336 RepID=A0A0V0RRG1_9BILA|nr:hypothetical protein T07_9303 [Trichinella nelsoni]